LYDFVLYGIPAYLMMMGMRGFPAMAFCKAIGFVLTAALALLAAAPGANAAPYVSFVWDQNAYSGGAANTTNAPTLTGAYAETRVYQISSSKIEVVTFMEPGFFFTKTGSHIAFGFNLGGFASGVTVSESILTTGSADPAGGTDKSGWSWVGASGSTATTQTMPLSGTSNEPGNGAYGSFGNFTTALTCNTTACPSARTSASKVLDFTLTASSGAISYNNLVCNGTAGTNGCGYYFTADSYNQSLNVTGVVSAAKKIPEPASMALLGAGVLGLAAIRRRQRA